MEKFFKRYNGESDEDCIYRICELKEELGYTWPQMADVLNEVLQKNYSDSKYRKDFTAFQKTGRKKIYKIPSTVEDKELETKEPRSESTSDEYYKLKKQFQDQRREYYKLLAKDARFEHLTSELVKAANKLNDTKMLCCNDICFGAGGDEEAVLCLTDWHYGMVTDNIWNRYNTDICVERVNDLLNKVKNYLCNHSVNRIHVLLLGDFIHGAIHSTVRVASEENACEQLMHVSEILAEFINELSNSVNEVCVHSTYGNHARTIQNKKDSVHEDNMERIIPWWLSWRLKDNSNVHVVENKLYEFIYLNVLGHDIIGVHGDLESFNKLGIDMHTLFSKKYGFNVEYVFSGDKHHMDSNDPYGIETVLIRSLCGSDEYANSKRLYSKAGQTLCIFNKEDGKICTYNITF